MLVGWSFVRAEPDYGVSDHVLCGMQADNLLESLVSLRRAASGLEPVGRLLRSQALATRNHLRSPDVVPHAVGTVSAETGELRILLADMSIKPGSKHCFQLSTISVRWDWSAGLASGEQSASQTAQSEVPNSSDEQPIPRRRRRVAAAAAPSSESDLEQESDPESGLADDSDSGAESQPDAAIRPAKRPKKKPKKSTAR
jgi:hypothetical protein